MILSVVSVLRARLQELHTTLYTLCSYPPTFCTSVSECKWRKYFSPSLAKGTSQISHFLAIILRMGLSTSSHLSSTLVFSAKYSTHFIARSAAFSPASTPAKNSWSTSLGFFPHFINTPPYAASSCSASFLELIIGRR